MRATTSYRYAWIVDRYVLPRLGEVSLRSFRADHLDDLYNHLLSGGGKRGGPLAPETVQEAHLVVRNALDLAIHIGMRRGELVGLKWHDLDLDATLARISVHRTIQCLASRTG